jgi:hypothetical protein
MFGTVLISPDDPEQESRLPEQEESFQFVDPPDVVRSMDSTHVEISSGYVRLFSHIATADRLELWRNHGAHDLAHWLSMRYGMSWWRADRWVQAARALENLPRISAALSRAELSVDQAVELTRLATTETEPGLVGWARDVSPAAIRRRAELERRRGIEESSGPQQSRYLKWWYFDGGARMALEGELPAAEGAQVASALDKVAESLPAMPDEDPRDSVDQRRADALVALCSGGTEAAGGEAEGPPSPWAADRAVVVVHATAQALASEDAGAEIDGGRWSPPEWPGAWPATAGFK